MCWSSHTEISREDLFYFIFLTASNRHISRWTDLTVRSLPLAIDSEGGNLVVLLSHYIRVQDFVQVGDRLLPNILIHFHKVFTGFLQQVCFKVNVDSCMKNLHFWLLSDGAMLNVTVWILLKLYDASLLGNLNPCIQWIQTGWGCRNI